MSKAYYPGSGDVRVTIGAEELVLKPTLEAGLALSRQGGGFRAAMQKVLDLDLDMIVAVIRLGVGREEAKRLKNIDRLVYENGLTDAQGEVAAQCIQYLANLSRGGRPDDADDNQSQEEGDTSGDPPKPQAPPS